MTLRPFLPTSTLVLLSIVLLALCVAGFELARRSRKNRPGSGEHPALPWGRRALIGALTVFALAGPAVAAEEIEVSSNIEIVFAVDRTGSMAAEDLPGGETRLSAVSKNLITLLKATAGSRYAIVTWDSEARVELPFTTDGSAAQSFANVLHQEITEFSKGSSIDRPVPTILDLLSSAEEQRPENIRYLVVMTDGETTDSASADSSSLAATWGQLKPFIDGGAVLGYGTDQGGPMRSYAPGQGLDGDVGEYMTDPSAPAGSPTNEAGESLAISRVDTEALSGIADALGVDLYLNPPESQVEALGETMMTDAESLPDRTGLRYRYRYMVWIPALAIALLLVWEVTSDARELSRMRRSGAI